MNDEFATQLEQLADRFDSITPEKFASPELLALQIGSYAIQAGKLVGASYRAGRLTSEKWIQGLVPHYLNAPVDSNLEGGMQVGSHFDLTYRSDEERYLSIWTFTVGSWAAKFYPERMRYEAAELDWTHWNIKPGVKPVVHEVRDESGRLVEWSSKLPNDALVCEEALFDEKQAIARQCARAGVYADACRLLAWCIQRDAKNALPNILEPTPGFFSAVELARRHNIPEGSLGALRKRLQRWRERTKFSSDWVELASVGKNEDRFLYRELAVIDLILENQVSERPSTVPQKSLCKNVQPKS